MVYTGDTIIPFLPILCDTIQDVLPGGGTHRKGDQIWTLHKAQGGEDMPV